MSDRTVVLVHGAWHGAWCWHLVQAALAEQGVMSVAVDLPGHGASPLPLGDLHGDADHLAGVLADVEGEVVLVGHSYGGAVITDAATSSPNVAHLVYLAAFCPDVGQSVGELAASSTEASALTEAIEVGSDGTCTLRPEPAVAALYADCPADEVEAALAALGPQPLASFGQGVRGAAWRDRPATYVVCTGDRAIDAGLQRRMAEHCASVVELAASHSPFLSMPGTVAGILAPLATA